MGTDRTYGRRHRTLPFLFTVVLVAVLAAPSAFAQDGTEPAPPAGVTGGGQGYLLDDGEFTPIQFPGAVGTLPYGINDKGQVVGVYDDERGRSHGFIFERGRYRTIDHPDATGTVPEGQSGTEASDINNRGQILGSYVGPDNFVHAYLLDLKRNHFRPVPDAPGATDTSGFALNDRGQITIQAFSPDDPFRHFLLDDGEFTRVQFPDAAVTVVHGINNRGEVVGEYGGGGPDDVQHGFTLRQGRYRTLDFPDVDHTGLNASNTRGQYAGYVVEGSLAQPDAVHGAIFSHGRLKTFDAPGPPDGPAATTAYDINSRGQIVGAKLPLLTPPDGAALSTATVPADEQARESDRDRDQDRDRPRHSRRADG